MSFQPIVKNSKKIAIMSPSFIVEEFHCHLTGQAIRLAYVILIKIIKVFWGHIIIVLSTEVDYSRISDLEEFQS